MDAVAKWPADRRRVLFEETAARRNFSAFFIEKDFWVCWALKRLFSLEGHNTLVFKGGTALSKVFGAIMRFSEDIDLSFDRSVFKLDEVVAEAKTVTQADKALDEIDQRAKEYVERSLLPDLEQAMQGQLAGEHEWALKIVKGSSRHWDYLDFSYPLSLEKNDYGFSDYNSPVVRIELVARGEHWPAQAASVKSYAAEDFPELFATADATVRALAIERTFWEKATLLHREYHVADTKPQKPGLSRHYADLAALADTEYGAAALRHIELLTTVAEHKAVYFREPSAKYETARPGTLRIVPSNNRLDELRSDYAKMAQMFFGEPVAFATIVEQLRQLEEQINSLAPGVGEAASS
jgi:hypothetical protein